MNRKFILFSVFFSLSTLFCINAEYFGPNLYGAQGPVKEIKFKTKYWFINNLLKYKFTKDGELKGNPFMKYDSQGLPSGYEIVDRDKVTISLKAIYNDKMLPDTIYNMSDISPRGLCNYVYIISYDDNNIPSECKIIFSSSEKKGIFHLTYSNYKLDKYNNWIERQALVIIESDGKQSEPESYLESRTISYYDN